MARIPRRTEQLNPEDDGRDPAPAAKLSAATDGLPRAERQAIAAGEVPSHEEAPPARKPLAEPTSTPETRRAAREDKANEAAGVGSNVFPSGATGESVTVTSGECLYTPKSFNSFRVGPFTATTTVRPGETYEDAGRRAQRSVDKLHAESFEKRLAEFIAEMRKVEGAMR